MTRDDEHLERSFASFAVICADYCPLYEVLSAQVAKDAWTRSLAAGGHKSQPAANMLFGAVQYLLLSGAQHDLRAYYPSVGGTKPPDDAYPVFVDFCRRYESEILELVATRLVQTNEVGRCGVLLPAFGSVHARFNQRPLHLLEVGSSAGLNLFFDRYHYEYSNGHCVGRDSEARVVTELRGCGVPVLPGAMPVIAGRVGMDLSPVDVNNDDAMVWLESLIWPDMVERFTLFRAARAIARQTPPTLLTGDALALLPEVIGCVNDGALPCVFHCHAIYQMDSQWREQFHALLAEFGRSRDVAHVSLEWLGDDDGPRLHVTVYRKGEDGQRRLLAEAHHHGKWLEWVDEDGR